MDGKERRFALDWRHRVVEHILLAEVVLVAAWTTVYATHLDTTGRRGRSAVLDCMRDLAGSDLLLSDRPNPLPRRCADVPFYALHPVWYSVLLAGATILIAAVVQSILHRKLAKSPQ